MSDQYTQPFPSVSAAPIQCCSHPLPDMQAEWTSNRQSGRCNQANGAKCCKPDTRYPQYHCSPPITGATKARMTINDFSAGGDGGGPSKCDEKYHSNKEKIVALSTGWFDNGNRCGKKIRISGNGNSVPATVVDECDSVNGCDTTSSLRATGISWTHRERCERRWESLNRRSATILSLGPTHRTANHSDLA